MMTGTVRLTYLSSEPDVSLATAKALYGKKDYKGAIKAGEDLLPYSSNPQLLSEVCFVLLLIACIHIQPILLSPGPPAAG